ncbi:MAG: radical SAM/SPASM domain-containing protein [Vicinamibacterales bacterium]
MEYGFGGGLSAAFPSQVIIDVTELCNLSCTHCPHPAFKQSDFYAGRSLSPELVSKAIGEVAGAGRGHVQYVRFASDGEPLLNKAIYPMLTEAVERSGTFVSLTTNGTLLTPPRIEQLIATGVHLVDISIDAFSAETYAKIRVRGDLAVTSRNVQRLIARVRESGSPMRIAVSYIEQPENAHETADFERFWTNAGAHSVAIRRLHSASGAVIPVAEVMRKQGAIKQRTPCVYPWERVVLTPRETLAFCPSDWTGGSSLVDYHTNTIADVWHSRQYEALRRAHLTNDYRGHAFCGQCPDWQETRWPGEGRTYATLVADLKETAA